MATSSRVPRTLVGRVAVAVVVAGLLHVVLAILTGVRLSPGVLAASVSCSSVSFLVFLGTFVQPRSPSETGREAHRRGRQELLSFLRSRRPMHLNLAVKVLRYAVEITPPEDPARPTYLAELGNALSTRYEFEGRVADLDGAIDADREAVAGVDDDDPARGTMLADLGASLLLRYGHSGDLADLDAAIAAERSAAMLIGPGDPGPELARSNLGGALVTRFERTGDPDDLAEGIAVAQQVLEDLADESPLRCMVLSNLGVGLRERFGRHGDDADLDLAIEIGRAAVAATPPAHPLRGRHLSNLAIALMGRYIRSRSTADLDAAIEVGRQASQVSRPGQPHTAMVLANLTCILRERFASAGDPADLDAAVDTGLAAVQALPQGHPHRAGSLSNLALAYYDRYSHRGHLADLAAADDAGRSAVDAAPHDDPDRTMYVSNLAVVLAERAERSGSAADLDALVELHQQAVDRIPADHPEAAALFNNLGMAHERRYESSGSPAERTAAADRHRQAAETATGPPGIRLKAARAWARVAAEGGEVSSAADGYDAAVALLSRVAWHGLDRSTREDQLSDWHGLAADAAAAALGAGRPERAVELLEQGRSVLWAQALQLRGDLSTLAEQAPGLLAELERIRAALDVAAATMPGLSPGRAAHHDRTPDRRHLAREWDRLLSQARQLPGLGNFLTAVPFAELREVASDGAVVLVNASRLGCHALLVEAGGEPGVRVVELPALQLADAVRHAAALRQAMAGSTGPGSSRSLTDREADRHALLDLLAWLWDAVAEPVLDALGHQEPVSGQRSAPRVWWCPTGPLTLLPLHAAGRHSRTNGRPTDPAGTVAGRVVSSYIPTLSALRHARRPGVDAAVPRQLAVGLSRTPGQAPLPAAREELAVLERHLPVPTVAEHLLDQQATRERVLAAIPANPWLHLACHAAQDDLAPSRSAFLLWDAPLTLSDLASLRMDGGELAFLSACQTAAGSTRLADEAAHLAAGMLLLGYRDVVASLWPIHDSVAPMVADSFYAALSRDGTRIPAAAALHRAVERLRAERPADPLLWAPYVHAGR